MPRVSKTYGVGCCFVLRLPVERIVVAAMAEMEEASRCRKKIESGFSIAAGALENSTALAGPFLRLFQVEEQGEPDGEMVVAQTAGTLLEVRLEMKDGVAVLGVAGTGDFAQLLSDGVPLAQTPGRGGPSGEAAGRAGIARRESGGRAWRE